MKNLIDCIKEGLKINSKTKVSKSDEDIKTFKEFVHKYQNQIVAFTDKSFSINKKSKLHDKLNNILEIILGDKNSSNNLQNGLRYCNGEKYRLNIREYPNNNEFEVYCIDGQNHTKMIMSIKYAKWKNIIVTLREVDNYKKEFEEALIEGLKYMISYKDK